MLTHTPLTPQNGSLSKNASLGARRVGSRRARNVLLLGGCGLALGAFLGCSLLVKEHHQCETDLDCEGRQGVAEGSVCSANVCEAPAQEPEVMFAEGEDFSCVGDQSPPVGSGDDVVVSARFASVGSDVAPEGALVRVCNALDLGCTDPLLEIVPEEDGSTELTLPFAFTGYLEVVSDETLPAQLVFPRPVDENTVISGDGQGGLPRVPLFSELQMRLLVASVGGGAELNLEKTHVLIGALDCAEVPAPGLVLEVSDPDAEIVYVENQAPDTSLTSTGPDATAAALNVEPGLTRLHFRQESTGRLVTSVTVPTLAGRVVFFNAPPTE